MEMYIKREPIVYRVGKDLGLKVKGVEHCLNLLDIILVGMVAVMVVGAVVGLDLLALVNLCPLDISLNPDLGLVLALGVCQGEGPPRGPGSQQDEGRQLGVDIDPGHHPDE